MGAWFKINDAGRAMVGFYFDFRYPKKETDRRGGSLFRIFSAMCRLKPFLIQNGFNLIHHLIHGINRFFKRFGCSHVYAGIF